MTRTFIVPEPTRDLLSLKAVECRAGWLPSRQMSLEQVGKEPGRLRFRGKSGDKAVKLDRDGFEELWLETEDARLHWFRRNRRVGQNDCVIDTYTHALEGLTTAEFQVHGKPGEFEKPSWCGLEISYDARFTQAILALGGLDVEAILKAHRPDYDGAIGAIPYLWGSDGLALVLVTTSRKDRWIYPKGQPKPGVDFKDIALMEAAEEAGIVGEMRGEPILSSFLRNGSAVNLILYPLHVKSLLKVWQESDTRNRTVMSLASLKTLAEFPELEAGLRHVVSLTST